MLHEDDMLMNKLLSKKFTFFPDSETVNWLRKLAREYKKASNNKANDVLHVLKDHVHYVVGVNDFSFSNKLTKAAVLSAVSRFKGIGAWEREDYSMYSMFLNDAADHLQLAILLEAGASGKRIYTALWNMDTASRDEMDEAVWDYACPQNAS